MRTNRIHHIDTNTGKHTETFGDDDEIKSIITKVTSNGKGPRLRLNGYHVRLYYDYDMYVTTNWADKKRTIFKGDKWIKTIKAPHESAFGQEYFIGQKINYSDYSLFLSNFIRSAMKKDIVFPQELIKCIYDYENRQTTYFITDNGDALQINKL